MSPEIIIQDLGQLQRLYPNSWSTILANCDVQLLFGANDQLTARYISDKLGTKTIRTASVGQSQSDRSAGVSESQSYTGRPLLMPDEVMSLPRDEVLLFLRGQRPLRLHKAPFGEIMDSARIEQRDPAAFSPPERRPLTVTGPSTLPTPAPKAQAAPRKDPLSFMDKGK